MPSSHEALAQLKWKSDDSVLDAWCCRRPFFQSYMAGMCLPDWFLSFQTPCLLKPDRRCLYTQISTGLLEVTHSQITPLKRQEELPGRDGWDRKLLHWETPE